MEIHYKNIRLKKPINVKYCAVNLVLKKNFVRFKEISELTMAIFANIFKV